MNKSMLTAGLVVLFGLTSVLSAFATPKVSANNSASATAVAKANIIRGITLVKAGDLNFGQIVPNGGGVVTIAVNGSRTATDAAMLLPDSYDAPSAAAFDVTGDGGHNYQIVLPDSVTIVNGDGAKMEVTKFVSTDGLDHQLDGKLNELGADKFAVGASLTVAAAQAPGAYVGEFEVTVSYQ